MYSDENKSSALAKEMNPFDYVILDTCSLMDDAFPEWMDILHNAKEYRKKEQPVLVPRRCYEEIRKHARQKKDDSKRIAAKRALKILRRAKWSHLLTITKKDKSENFADNAIFVKVSADRLFSKILVITQDKALASDLNALNQLRSQAGRLLAVRKFINGGRLAPNYGEKPTPKEHNPKLEAKPLHPTPKATPSPVEAVLAADARLSANLNNPNYPGEKLKADAQAQLQALEKLNGSTKAQLSLLIAEPRLKEILKPVPVKAEPKPEPKPKPKPEEPKAPAKEKLWYGVGKTIAQGFEDCGKHYGMLFHDPSVAYFAPTHGPLDLTSKDLEAIEAKALPLFKEDKKVEFDYRGLHLFFQKVGENYRCWIDVNQLPSKLSPLPKATRGSKKKVAVSEEKPAETPKKEAKPKAKAAPKKAPKAPVEGDKAKPEPKQEKKEKPSPKKEPAKKETPKKPAKAKEPAKKTKEEPKKASSESLEKLLKAQARLRAVIPNANYATASKIKDLESFLAQMKELSPEEASKLYYRPEAIEALIADLKKEEK